jgi:hypothetical protein
MELLNYNVSCPYCGENIELLIDDSVDEQEYYEDCSVCCRPIRIQQRIGYDGESLITVLRDDE